MNQKFNFTRRKFLKASTFGLISTGIAVTESYTQAEKQADEDEIQPSPKVKEYRILGRTGFKVSDIACGSIYDEGVLSAMLDAGVNYIDTAESYPGHHKIVSQVIKGRDRKSIFITSKMEVKEDTSKEGFLTRGRKCLEELQTDYIDCLMMHMPEKVETLKTEGFHAAMQQLKSEGKIRSVGVSNHGSFWFKDPEETMEKMLLAAAEDGRFDVFLMAYNFLQMDQSERVLEVCRDKKIGTALMKTTPVAKYYILKSRVEQLDKEEKEVHPLYREGLKRFREKADKAEYFVKKYGLNKPEEIKKAAVQFVLSNPNVNTVCYSLRTYEEMEQAVRLSGTRLGKLSQVKLDAYKEACGELYCRHACGLCEPSCPHGVPINTIMRYLHYFMSQAREREAILNYGNIPGIKADVCRQCQGFCEAACPYNVPIQGMLLLAHDQLTL